MPISPLYPLRFQPLFKRYLWGGRRLGEELGKAIGPEDDYAESWEVADHDQDQSVVAGGPLSGVTLGDLVQARGVDLLGRHAPQTRFPLLFKFLDCRRVLSVQVHPDDAAAALLNPPDLGKTEAWLILAAEPGSVVYAGLKRGFDRPALEREVRRGTTELCLHKFAPLPGDCLFIPAGTVHALGAGLLVAEIQQASDTTFRLFDWQRAGPDGQPRKLHVEESLAAINYAAGPVAVQAPLRLDRHRERLVDCDQFILERWRLPAGENDAIWSTGGGNRFYIISVIKGGLQVAGDVAEQPLQSGQTMLLPAAGGAVEMRPAAGAEILVMYLP